MTIQEAVEWLHGERSTGNLIPSVDPGTWQVQTAQADAAMIQQAYWVIKAYKEGLIKP